MKNLTGRRVGEKPHSALFALALIVFLAHASASSPAQGGSNDAGKDTFSSKLAGCLSRGGTVAHGPRRETYCRIAYPDGGKACIDASECIGGCIYFPRSGPLRQVEGRIVGICQRANVQYGCFWRVENGLAKHMRCAD